MYIQSKLPGTPRNVSYNLCPSAALDLKKVLSALWLRMLVLPLRSSPSLLCFVKTLLYVSRGSILLPNMLCGWIYMNYLAMVLKARGLGQDRSSVSGRGPQRSGKEE